VSRATARNASSNPTIVSNVTGPIPGAPLRVLALVGVEHAGQALKTYCTVHIIIMFKNSTNRRILVIKIIEVDVVSSSELHLGQSPRVLLRGIEREDWKVNEILNISLVQKREYSTRPTHRPSYGTTTQVASLLGTVFLVLWNSHRDSKSFYLFG
jgi:hypothetical protein